MSGGPAELRADGLPIAPLLQYGTPSPEVLECILKDLDQQLLENQRQLEDCLLDMMQFSNEKADTSEAFEHPLDAINYLIEHRLLDDDTCYDIDVDAITKLLNHVLDTLESSPGGEDSILQELLQLGSVDGFVLPFRRDSADDASGSVLSINTAVTQSESVNSALWRKITDALEGRFLARLQQLSVGDDRGQRAERLTCVQSLCTLVAPQKVWTKYRALRQRQLAACFACSTSPRRQHAEGTFKGAATRLEKALPRVLAMMRADIDLLASGAFEAAADNADAVHAIFQAPLLAEVDAVVDRLAARKDRKASSPMIRKVGGGDKAAGSETGFLGHLRESLRRQSSSLDNLLVCGAGGTVPLTCLAPLARLVSALDEVMRSAEEMLSVSDGGGRGGGDRTPATRRSLKSALKRSGGLTQMDGRPWYSSRSTESGGMLPLTVPMTGERGGHVTVSVNVAEVEKALPTSAFAAWQDCFSRMTPGIARCIATFINDALQNLLADDEAQMLHGQLLQTTSVSEKLVRSKLDYPPVISKSLLMFVREIDKLLPLATCGIEGALQPLHDAFTDGVTGSFKQICDHITEMSMEVTKSVALPHLYLLVSNAAYIRNKLLHYDATTQPGGATGPSPLSSLYHECCHLVGDLTSQLIECHNEALQTCILHDSESHDWQSKSHFYEDERCAFSVQMWHVHVCALRRDLWSRCPPALGRDILTAVLAGSLRVFAERYSHAKPSYRRANQIKTDITAILLCTSQHLFLASSSPAHFVQPRPPGLEDTATSHAPYNDLDSLGQLDVATCHAHCSTLLSVLAIVTAPIDLLYRVFKKGFPGKKALSDEEVGKGHLTQWLSWIRPALFPPGEYSFDALQTTTAVYLQVRHLLAQPTLNDGMLMQALLMKDCTLPIMLLVQAARQTEDEVPREVSTERRQAVGLFTPFIDILLKCSEFPMALSNVLMPVIERTDAWHLFEAKTIIGKTTPMPVWMEAILQCLSPFCERAVEPGLRLLMATPPLAPPPGGGVLGGLTHLPCGCELATPLQPDTPEIERQDTLSEAIYSIVMQLVEDVSSLPAPLVVFLRTANVALSTRSMHAPHDCVGIKLLATGLRHCLLAEKPSMLGNSDVGQVDENRRMLTECVYHILTASSYGKGSGTPRLAGGFMKRNRNWLAEQVDVIREHLTDQLFEAPTAGLLDGATAEFSDDVFEALATDIVGTTSGQEHLVKVHRVIERNARWIETQLDIPPLLGQTERNKMAGLDLSTQPITAAATHCLQDYCTIDNCKFDHAAIGQFDYDWCRLLRCDLGLTEVGFRTLLSHRHELTDDADLDENERRPADGLRARFLQSANSP